MRIPTWRLALTGAALAVLAVAGIGFAAAAGTGGTQGAPTVETAPSTGTGTDTAPAAAPQRPALAGGLEEADGRLGRLGGRLVHAEATVQDKDGNLIKINLDHGTIKAIGNGSITISEAGDSTVVVKTDADTKVRIGRAAGTLADLKVGDEIFVQSRVDGGTVLAKHVLQRPAATTTSGG
jgi:Cu/Ag efflux protein CusF